jgi:ubiquitin carboxyl-terminal hydrolase 16
MPDKPATIAAYAAGASLAAITLFYVFGPNFTIDGEDSNISGRQKGIVGLSNPANDCFINSVLQALAGLGDLRLYLIRELHRRKLEGSEVYNSLPDVDTLPRGDTQEKIWHLQQAPVTKAMKEMLDSLNERPIYKKTISARGFVQALELAFRTRISRNQQDAQEFLQIIAERLCDEYHASANARKRLDTASLAPEPIPRALGIDGRAVDHNNSNFTVRIGGEAKSEGVSLVDTGLSELDTEYGFPFEGKTEAQIECQFCQFQSKPKSTPFVNLTLQVPQKSSTTLSSCFDGLLKTEYIEDYRCENCRLLHALEWKQNAMDRAKSEQDRNKIENEISLIKSAIENDPERIPEGVALPDVEDAPKRRIARNVRITVFPKIIAIHLSRSIFDQSSSTKNAAKVSFPERLPLGSIVDRRWYKLLAIVCHKGSHNSGHYESFRRNYLYPPFSTPDVFRSYAQSRSASENPSAMPSPKLAPFKRSPDPEVSSLSISPSSSTSSTSISGTSIPLSNSSRPSSSPVSGGQLAPPPATPRASLQSNRSASTSIYNAQRATIFPTSDASPQSHSSLKSSKTAPTGASRLRRRKRSEERWWRISDEKIKECKTSDVLGMQKEVYLLFYEMERPENDGALV